MLTHSAIMITSEPLKKNGVSAIFIHITGDRHKHSSVMLDYHIINRAFPIMLA